VISKDIAMRQMRITKKAANAFKNRKAEETIYGSDPAKEGAAFEPTQINIIHALNWYASLGEIKSLRKSVEAYAKKALKIDLSSARDCDFSTTVGGLAKMRLASCPLPQKNIDFLHNKIKEISKRIVIEEKLPKEVKFNNNENQLICDAEDMLDVFYNSNYKSSPVDFFNYLKTKDAKPGAVRELIAYYIPLLEEIPETNLKPIVKRKYTAFVQKIIDDSNQFLSNNRAIGKLRKPRKKKVKSADQLASKVNYKRQDEALKIVSVNPTSIIKAGSVWLYNTKYKRMTYLEASNAEGLSIRGTTILNFDPKKSICKTIRKPEITLPEILNSGKVTMHKLFLKLKTKNAAANGRLNNDVLILRVNKIG